MERRYRRLVAHGISAGLREMATIFPGFGAKNAYLDHQDFPNSNLPKQDTFKDINGKDLTLPVNPIWKGRAEPPFPLSAKARYIHLSCLKSLGLVLSGRAWLSI